MSSTPNLTLSYLAAGQAQKHVTLNESLRMLDAILQLSVLSRSLATPPATPTEGDRYIIPAAGTGVWAGKPGKIAAWQDGGWLYYAPREGWLAWARDEDRLYAYDGAAWIWAIGALQNLAFLGLNASADATNRLTIAASATLLNHDGAGHQLKVNKAAASQTASLLFQTGFSGRAEIGTTGDDKLRFKASADGVTWKEALTVDGATGNVGIGQPSPSTRLHVAGPVRVGETTVAALPSASASGAGALVMVTNESGGAVLAFSDGTAWRRVTDRAVVT